MAGNPSKDKLRGTEGQSPQDLINQSFDHAGFHTLVAQIMGSPDGTNLYPIKVNADGSINAVTGGSAANTNNVFMEYKSTDSNIIYIGEAANASLTSNPAWKITRLDTTTLLKVTYADGDLNFDNVWDNRESLTYS